MKVLLLALCFALVAPPSHSLPPPPLESEDSVVSIYTTPASGNKTNPLDIYQQIAYNVATRITTPIYRFFGYGTNKTENATGSRTQWGKIEILDETPDDTSKLDVKPLSTNYLGVGRDVEELSDEAQKKAEQKPEKITLYSNYLNWFDSAVAAQNAPIVRNDTLNEVSDKDDELSIDDIDIDIEDDKDKPREGGGLVYFLELIGSWIQLIYGGLTAIFNPKSYSG